MSFCQNCILPLDSEANCDGADAEFHFPLFFSFSASFLNETIFRPFVGLEFLKVEKLSSFCYKWGESHFVSIILANIIFFPALTRATHAKKILAKPFAHAISEHYRNFEHAYVY